MKVQFVSPGRRTAKAMHPFLPECLLITSAADMHAVSDTRDDSPPSNADVTLDLNSRVTSYTRERRGKMRIYGGGGGRPSSIINNAHHDKRKQRGSNASDVASMALESSHRSRTDIFPSGSWKFHVRRHVCGGRDRHGRCHNRPEQSHPDQIFFFLTDRGGMISPSLGSVCEEMLNEKTHHERFQR